MSTYPRWVNVIRAVTMGGVRCVRQRGAGSAVAEVQRGPQNYCAPSIKSLSSSAAGATAASLIVLVSRSAPLYSADRNSLVNHFPAVSSRKSTSIQILWLLGRWGSSPRRQSTTGHTPKLQEGGEPARGEPSTTCAKEKRFRRIPAPQILTDISTPK